MRATRAQIEVMINYLAEHRNLARNLLTFAQAFEGWRFLSDTLNAMTPERQPMEPTQWCKVRMLLNLISKFIFFYNSIFSLTDLA